MIDKDVLIDMGFRLSEGYDYDVYYHDSDFFVHFGGDGKDFFRWDISGDATMKEFFKKFLDNFEAEIQNRWVK